MKNQLVCVGSMAYDIIETEEHNTGEILGGSATYFSAAASFFTHPAVVSVVGDDFKEDDLRFLRERDIDTEGISIMDGKTFRWSGCYIDNFQKRETKCTELNVFSMFDPVIPEEYKDAEVVFLGNIDPVLQKNVLEQMNSPKLVALDTMNFWISLKKQELLEVLPLCDILFVNDEESIHLTGEKNIIRAARMMLTMGPKKVIIKKGEHGAVLFQGEDVLFAPPFPVSEVVDPTGAGDSFAGGFMGYLTQNPQAFTDIKEIGHALAMGSIIASFCVEGFSPKHFASVTKEQINARSAYYKKMCIC